MFLDCTRDSPNLFHRVPVTDIGATIEDTRVRPAVENEAFVAMSCLKYGVAAMDDKWWNSGVLLLSSEHIPLLEDIPRDMDPLILWDQGFLNARRHSLGLEVHNLGYEYNYLGSFNGSNQRLRPFDVADAFMVHGTTGLPDYGKDRSAFFTWVASVWGDVGQAP